MHFPIILLIFTREAWSWNSRNAGNGATRRQFVGSAQAIGIIGSSFALLNDPLPTSAASTTDPGEVIRQSASSLPGYGPPDVYYPQAFHGSWKMRREVVVGDKTALDLTYSVRFLPSIQDGFVVADRGFNQANLEDAIAIDSVQTCDWRESNPNDLRLTFKDGRIKDVKVTKRSFERTDTTVSSSEFQRVVTQDVISGVPQITARRVLAKWKASNGNGSEAWQGIEIVYDIGGGGDPMSLTTLSSSPQPDSQVLLSKSRLTLTRE
ncbi:hypothetical protein MPSEU_000635200 [Mayamaea pseudoterrestris]|nr:hypothetical protein MPSEU_000635200 [Mayamaea pseudoterrestris]